MQKIKNIIMNLFIYNTPPKEKDILTILLSIVLMFIIWPLGLILLIYALCWQKEKLSTKIKRLIYKAKKEIKEQEIIDDYNKRMDDIRSTKYSQETSANPRQNSKP